MNKAKHQRVQRWVALIMSAALFYSSAPTNIISVHATVGVDEKGPIPQRRLHLCARSFNFYVYDLEQLGIEDLPRARVKDMYFAEYLIGQSFKNSPCRTADPEAADLFVVPAQPTAALHGGGSGGGGTPADFARALEYLRSVHIAISTDGGPYFNMSQGEDHVWIISHDIGSCLAPIEISKGIFIQSNGDKVQNTACLHEYLHKSPSKPPSELLERAKLPCYDPEKDKMSSLESELPALHWGGRPHIISYREPWKTRFDLVMAGLIVYVAVTLPVRIGFQLDASDGVFIFECILEVLFLLDLLFNFFTTFDDTNTKEEVRDHRRIVRRYLRGDFVLDCLSSFPFNLLSLMLPLSAGSSWFKILRVLRLGRVSAIRKFMEGMEKRTENPVLFRIVGIILVFLLVVHMVACLFWLTASSQGFINLGLDEFGLLDRGRSWVPTLDVLDGGFWAQYSKSVAFALANLSGSAMGSETVKEYWFESAAFLLGFLINATIIASASSLLSNMDIQAMEKKNHLDRINNYMRSTNVNQGLQAKIRGYYHFLWDIGMSNYSQTILRELPPKLHLQLNLTLKKPLVEKCPLFKTCSPAAVIAIVQNLHALIILPNDLVVKAGEKADCMFFINRGSVSIFIPSVDPDGKDCVEYLVTLKKGAFFGEVGILDPSSKRTANVLSEQYCELQVLKARDCQVLLDSFPEFSEAIQYLAQKRRRAAVSKRGASFSRRLGAAGVPYRPGENPSRRRSSISSMIKSPAAQTRRWSQSKKFSQDQQSFSKEFGSRSLTQQDSTDKSRSTKKSSGHQQSSLASGADDNEVMSKRQSLESMAKEEDSVSFFSSSHGTASSKKKTPQKEPLGAKKGEKYAAVVNNIDCNAGDAESAENSSKNAEQSAVQAALPSPSFAKASTIKLKRVATTIKLVNRMGGGNQGAASQKKEEQNFYEEVLNAENNISYGMARDFSAGVGIAEAKLEEAVAEKDLIMHTPHPSDLDTEAD